ncbi:hypothetical protein [Bradyrhizobium sp. 137]|uniref:hypothetical protein n=1 Tax=Bradyrhizobium sp. 137 TaxID=2782614 RepID=UPI001FF9E7F8|nr:hypothetical protein [Bradyrhizobium sp. 137]
MLSTTMTGQANSRGSMAAERPWAPEHIEGLPKDIRRHVAGHVEACGNAPARSHYFLVFIEASGLRFRAQHFEDFACARPSLVCRPSGCLHEVFADDGRRQWLVFSVYARDMKLTKEGGTAGIEVVDAAGVRSFAWNGRRFAPSRARKTGR